MYAYLLGKQVGQAEVESTVLEHAGRTVPTLDAIPRLSTRADGTGGRPDQPGPFTTAPVQRVLAARR